MIKYSNKYLAGLLAFVLPGIIFAQAGEFEIDTEVEAALTSPADVCLKKPANARFFELALTIAENIRDEIKDHQHPSPETLQTAFIYHQTLSEMTYNCLPKDLHKIGSHFIQGDNRLDPQTLKCSKFISTQQKEHLTIGMSKLFFASLLLYFNYDTIALAAMLFPSDYLTSGSMAQKSACQKLWKQEGLSASNVHWISDKMDALSDTAFFSTTTLNLKYQDLAKLPWEASDTWSDREWKQVDQIFLKIQTLLAMLYHQMVSHPEEDVYIERLRAIGQQA